MNTKRIGQSALGLGLALTLAAGFALAAAAQEGDVKVLPVSKEPHHHHVLENSYVQVYHVHATKGDGVLMHRHEYDMISIQTGATETTVHYPDNKPSTHQAIEDGQIRYQLAGLVHSTEVMRDDQPFNNITIALIHPQTNKHNLCVAVLAGEPLQCANAAPTTPGIVELPEMATDQTRISLLRAAPRAEVAKAQASQPELLVALDEAALDIEVGDNKKTSKKLMHPGDVAWFDAAGPMLAIINKGDNPARIVTLELKP